MDWTIVRSTEFMANALAWADSVRSGAPVLAPFATVAGAPVHQADIAAVIVAALLEDGHHRRIHTLTGPELLTPLDQARLIGEAIGRDVLLEEITPARARELWLELGTPAEVADWLLEAGAAAEFTTMLPTVEQITGRPARTFARWAADHAADFR